MNLNALNDNELIDYVIKHDDDPVRIRLATYMQRMKGAIMDGLLDAGMDDTWCEFTSVVTAGKYHPGDYIRHLENEIEFLENQVNQNLKEIKELQARSIMDLIGELKQEIKTAEYCMREANRECQLAKEHEQQMRSKLDMWAIMNR